VAIHGETSTSLSFTLNLVLSLRSLSSRIALRTSPHGDSVCVTRLMRVTSGQCPYPEEVELAADLAADLPQHDELIADAHQD